MKRLKVSYEGIEPIPGHVIILKPQELICRDEARTLLEISRKAFPDNSVVILPNCDVVEVDKEQFIEFLDQQKKWAEENL